MSQPPDESLTVEQLLAVLAERSLEVDERRRLNELIRDEEELARVTSNLEMDALLQWHFGRVPQVEIPPADADQPDARDATPAPPAGDRLPGRRRRLFSRVVRVVTAATILGVLVGVGLILMWPRPPVGVPIPDNMVRLTSGWLVRPTGDARFAVIAPGRVRLDRGELFVQSAAEDDAAPRQLSIETPSATATADGTEFYIGAHVPSPAPSDAGATNLIPLTRVLVLAGAVTLSNSAGEVRGEPGDLLAVVGDSVPERMVVQANNDFAWKLHAQLVRESPGENVFFSPYSVATALAMAQEGARGETALEMGNVLEFPGAAGRIGDDAQLIPWRTALLHTGMAQLQERLNSQESESTRELRARIATLRAELDAANGRTVALERQDDFDAAIASQREARALAQEINELLTQVDQYQLAVANAIWGDRSYPFNDGYVETINETFQSEGVFSVDFANDHEAARGDINDWAAEQTGGMVPELLDGGAVGPLTRLVLTNAVYFLGEWSEPFREGNTQPQSFDLADGESVEVPLMSDLKRGARYGAVNADGSWFATPEQVRVDGEDADARYPADDGFQILELPYKGGELSMVLLLPRATDGLPRLHALLTSGRFDEWISQTENRNVRVFVPKFEAEGSFLLRGTLRELGMDRAFSADPPPVGADFSGMTASSDPQLRLSIDEVIHKARISMHERGTEAVAATAITLDEEASAPPESRPDLVPFTPEFRADRPFVYLIRDRQTVAVLFVGTMEDPSS